ncbi:MAG: hypothetical protein IJS54_06060 [Desulfovibrio sp.]|nr:hypothetical protein [Desulfovibrio sp.]
MPQIPILAQSCPDTVIAQNDDLPPAAQQKSTIVPQRVNTAFQHQLDVSKPLSSYSATPSPTPPESRLAHIPSKTQTKSDIVKTFIHTPNTLPDPWKGVLHNVQETLAKNFGAKAFQSMDDRMRVGKMLSQQKGALTPAQLKKLLTNAGKTTCAVQAFARLCENHGLHLPEQTLRDIMRAHDLPEQIQACATKKDLDALVEKHKASIVADATSLATIENEKSHCVDTANAMLANVTHLPQTLIAQTVQWGDLASQASMLAASMAKNPLPTPSEIKSQFHDLAQQSLLTRSAVLDAVDTLDLSPQCKEAWKEAFLTNGLPAGLSLDTLESLVALAKKHDVPTEAPTSQNLDRLAQDLNAAIALRFGEHNKAFLLNLACQVVLDAHPSFAKAIQERTDLTGVMEAFIAPDTHPCHPLLANALPQKMANTRMVLSLFAKDLGHPMPLGTAKALCLPVLTVNAAFGTNFSTSIADILALSKDGLTLQDALRDQIHQATTPVGDDELAAMVKDFLTPLAQKEALAHILHDVDPTSPPKERSLAVDILAKNTPLASAKNREDILAAFDAKKAQEVLTGLQECNRVWENALPSLATDFASRYHIPAQLFTDHAKGATVLSDRFAEEYQNKQTPPSREWYAKTLDAFVQEKKACLAQLRDGENNDQRAQMIARILADTTITPTDLHNAFALADHIAENLDTSALGEALASPLSDHALVQALTSFGASIRMILPHDQTQQVVKERLFSNILSQNRETLFTPMATLPPTSLKNLKTLIQHMPDSADASLGLELLSQARGMAARPWLPENMTQAIARGTASLSEENHLQNALTVGKELFERYAPFVPEEKYSSLRHTIGSLNATKDNLLWAENQIAQKAHELAGDFS